MRSTRNVIELHPSDRLLKTSILMFSLFAVQASVWYFFNKATSEGFIPSTGKVTFYQRKLLELSARPKSGQPSSSNDLEITNHTRKYNQHKDCSALRHLNSSEEKCRFIKYSDGCEASKGFFHYLQFPYCSLPSLVPVAFVILALWLIFLFITLGTTADDYFCPALAVISKTLRLSQNIAGVTFLAYGNGAPDIFSALVAFTQSSKSESTIQLGIQALFGAGLFVTTVVVGFISFMPAFTLTTRPFIRDVLFYLGAVSWAAITLHNQRISLYESIGFIAFYVMYVLVVIVGHCIYQRWKPKLRERSQLQSSGDSLSSSIEWCDQHNDTSIHNDTSQRLTSRGLAVPIDTEPAIKHSVHTVSEALLDTEKAVVVPAIHGVPNPDLESTSELESPSGETVPLLGGQPRVSEWRKFLQGVEPIDREEWSESKLLQKCFLICKAPAVLCLNLTVPVVDYGKENHNWNKWLNVLHCVTVPLFCVMATKAGSHVIGGKFPAWALALLVGLVLASMVAITTKKNKRPRAHFVFAYLAFAASVIWIYSTANEIVNLLQTFGVVSGISDAVLGLTFLAWGNSIGDLVSNRAMARQGFPRMAVSACFGGPLLNMLLGIGLSCTIVTVSQGHPIHLPHRYHQYIISAGFLAASLASSAIVIPLLGFRVPRTFGVFLFILYLTYLIVSITAEIKHL